MTSQLTGGLIAVAVVVALGLLARRANTPDSMSQGGGSHDPRPDGSAARERDRDAGDEELTAEDEAMLDELGAQFEDDAVAAVTSDGYALVPHGHAVRLVPPDESGESWKPGSTAADRRGERALAMSWHAGDLTGARMVRGAADEAPWRLEGLGRDGEYTAFLFETESGAAAALQVFESRGVIRLGTDDEGEPVAPSAEQFEEARRIFLETEAALEMPEEDDEQEPRS